MKIKKSLEYIIRENPGDEELNGTSCDVSG
jgi:hypothetical protein